MSERDTKFKGFAKLLFDDVADMFNNLYIELDNCEEQQAEKTKQDIIDYFAQRAYDLMKEACWTIESEENDGRLTENAMLRRVPDLTEWPEEGKEKES